MNKIQPFLLLLFFTLFLLISCRNTPFEEHKYYTSGELMETKHYASKNDTLNYNLKSFYKSGRLKSREDHSSEGFQFPIMKTIFIE